MRFGKILKELRESNGYSMDVLVELYNKTFDGKMNKSTLSRYENGLQEPMYTVVVNLSKLFDVTVDYLSGADTEEAHEFSNDNDLEISPEENKLLSNFRKLNSSGKEKASDYVEDLTTIDKYTAAAEIQSKLG